RGDVRRPGRLAGAVAVDGLRPPRALCVAPLSARPARAAGVRQGMTEAYVAAVPDDELRDRNRRLVRVLLTIMAALIVASLLVGIGWWPRSSRRRHVGPSVRRGPTAASPRRLRRPEETTIPIAIPRGDDCSTTSCSRPSS